MAHHQSTIDLAVAPEAAFAYLADVTNAPAWDRSVVEAVPLGDGPVGAGSQFRVVVGFFGKRLEFTYEIERHHAPEELVLVARHKSAERRDEITVAPGPGGTGSRVVVDSHLRLKGAMRLLDRGLQMQFDTVNERAAAGLVAALGGVTA